MLRLYQFLQKHFVFCNHIVYCSLWFTWWQYDTMIGYFLNICAWVSICFVLSFIGYYSIPHQSSGCYTFEFNLGSSKFSFQSNVLVNKVPEYGKACFGVAISVATEIVTNITAVWDKEKKLELCAWLVSHVLE